MQKDLNQLTDQEVLEEAKKMKKAGMVSALLIGFMAGIIIFSVVKNTWGLVTLIPLYFIYKMVKSPSNKEEIEQMLKDRKVK